MGRRIQNPGGYFTHDAYERRGSSTVACLVEMSRTTHLYELRFGSPIGLVMSINRHCTEERIFSVETHGYPMGGGSEETGNRSQRWAH